jgi:hypothetical protein
MGIATFILSQVIIKLILPLPFSNIMVKDSAISVVFSTGTDTLATSFFSSYLNAPQVSVSLLIMIVHLSTAGMQ